MVERGRAFQRRLLSFFPPKEVFCKSHGLPCTKLGSKLYTREKSFCKTSFQVGMELKKYRNKAEMKERTKSTLHLQKYTADVG